MKGDELAYESYSAKGATVSLEAGYGFALNKSFGLEAAKYTWIFQPQAQAIWMGVDHNAVSYTHLDVYKRQTLCSIINGLDQDGENFIFGVDISYALYHALCRCQRERMNGIFMY